MQLIKKYQFIFHFLPNPIYFFVGMMYHMEEQSRKLALSAVGWGVDRRTKGKAHDEIFAPAAP